MNYTTSSDQELVAQTALGSSAAYAELWRRHAGAARAAARATTTIDADDLVAESFTRVLRLIQDGRGPSDAFRAYIIVTTRNIAAEWGRRNREIATNFLDDVAGPDTTERSVFEAHDSSLVARAFRSLPPRSQEVLWYTAVEGMSVTEVSPLLGLKPNAVAALSFRAREALRDAWIGLHIESIAGSAECEWTSKRLARHSRGTLRPNDRARANSHLDGCEHCRTLAAEVTAVDERLRAVLLPLLLGGGAFGYAQWIRSQAVPTQSFASPRSLRIARVMSGVAAAVALVAGSATLAQLPLSQLVIAQPRDGVPGSGGAASTVLAEPQSRVLPDLAQRVIALPALRYVAPEAEDAITSPPGDPQAPTPIAPPPPPQIELKSLPDYVLPAFSGVAEPMAVVRVSAVHALTGDVATWHAEANSSGNWSTVAHSLSEGKYFIQAVQITHAASEPSAVISVTVQHPPQLEVLASAKIVDVDERVITVTAGGTPGAHIELMFADVATIAVLDQWGTFTAKYTVAHVSEASNHFVRYRFGDFFGVSRSVDVTE